jgi:hypothetical protein
MEVLLESREISVCVKLLFKEVFDSFYVVVGRPFDFLDSLSILETKVVIDLVHETSLRANHTFSSAILAHNIFLK